MRFGINLFHTIIIRKVLKTFNTFTHKSSTNILGNQTRSIENKKQCLRINYVIIYINRIFVDVAVKIANISKYKIMKLGTRSSAYLLGALGTYIFDWDSERITLSLLDSLLKEHEYNPFQQDNYSKCNNCKSTTELCKCLKYNSISPIDLSIFKNNNSWELYLVGDEIKIWRKEEKPAYYSYRVYAKYEDITSYDFLHVQTDIKYRKQWDDTVVSLEIVESDPLDALSHVIYWETRWPKLFKNRDYIYCRRVFFDQRRNCIIICNRSTTHPKYPIFAEKQRVEEYWSYMIIKPLTEFHKPGLEFILVYFDNPGLNIPSTLSSWMAQKQMPDFLNKLHSATQKFSKQKCGMDMSD